MFIYPGLIGFKDKRKSFFCYFLNNIFFFSETKVKASVLEKSTGDIIHIEQAPHLISFRITTDNFFFFSHSLSYILQNQGKSSKSSSK